MYASHNPVPGEDEYIKVSSPMNIIDMVEEIDIDPYLLTTYQINNDILWQYPALWYVSLSLGLN